MSEAGAAPSAEHGFVRTSVLKRDIFSETDKGYDASNPDRILVRRRYRDGPLWARPLALILARREIAGLRAVAGIDGAPVLAWLEPGAIVKEWTDGTPLHLARPNERRFYDSAAHLLRQMRKAGVTHNDLAKPQNWLMRPDGTAAVIDLQLASRHRGRGRIYRILGYEDRRHLAKQKRSFAKRLMTPSERRLLKRRSLPSQIWFATGKRLYNLVTRGLFDWSDGEGTGDRLEREGPAIRYAALALDGVRDIALTTFPFPRKGVGIYAFVESDRATEGVVRELRHFLDGKRAEADLVQPVAALPRSADGTVRDDILRLIAVNQIDELEHALRDDPELRATVEPIVRERLNLTDRRLRTKS